MSTEPRPRLHSKDPTASTASAWVCFVTSVQRWQSCHVVQNLKGWWGGPGFNQQRRRKQLAQWDRFRVKKEAVSPSAGCNRKRDRKPTFPPRSKLLLLRPLLLFHVLLVEISSHHESEIGNQGWLLVDIAPLTLEERTWTWSLKVTAVTVKGL